MRHRSIGNVLKKKGLLAEAQSYYERALRGRAKSLGNDHLTTANTAAQLAALLAEQVSNEKLLHCILFFTALVVVVDRNNPKLT